MKKCLLALAALLLWLPGAALALTGQSYATFVKYYDADVTFINQNDNRHLMPMVLSQTKGNQDNNFMRYDLYGDVLSVNVVADIQGIIKTCDIKLTAPDNMAFGSAEYNDFAISGYHSFAFLMAMDAHADPAQRYQLVTDVVNGLKTNNGAYTRRLDAYTLTCSRNDTEALLSFVNDGSTAAEPSATPEPDNGDGDGSDSDTDGFIG